jgi:hypothetical protein
MLSAFEDLVKKPDYNMTVLNPYVISLEDNHIGFSHIMNIEYMKTRILLYQGKFDEAFQNAEFMICASQLPKYFTVFSLIHGTSGMDKGIRVWHLAVKQCNDSALLRRSLDRMRQVAPRKDIFDKDMPMSLLSSIGSILDAKRWGLDVGDIQGKTADEITLEQWRIYNEYVKKVLLPDLKEPEGKAKWKRYLKDAKDLHFFQFSSIFFYEVLLYL